MKRFFNFLVFTAAVLLFSSSVFAQSAKIIDLKGAVSVKKDSSLDWQKAKINMLLERSVEIRTGKNAICTLAFDEEMRNIMTVKENSQVQLESIIPAQVFLPEGRVFSLIENLSAIEKFEVRTPTVIAGARGTGLSVSFLNSKSLVSCYEHLVYVSCLDKKGSVNQNKELSRKYGLIVGPGCDWEGPFGLGAAELNEWNDYRAYVLSLQGPAEDDGSLGDAQDDSKESREDDLYEKRRQDNEYEPPRQGNELPT